MPMYEYRCDSCDLVFERRTKISNMQKLMPCPQCGALSDLLVSVGFTHGDEAAWINSELRGSLQDPKSERMHPITTRSEYKEYLKKNDIVERA